MQNKRDSANKQKKQHQQAQQNANAKRI